MKINEISLKLHTVPAGNPLRFHVGEPIAEGGYIVEKINFHPSSNLFNKGREVGAGCYSIFFLEGAERLLIMADTVSSVEVVAEKKKTVDTNVPELPE